MERKKTVDITEKSVRKSLVRHPEVKIPELSKRRQLVTKDSSVPSTETKFTSFYSCKQGGSKDIPKQTRPTSLDKRLENSLKISDSAKNRMCEENGVQESKFAKPQLNSANLISKKIEKIESINPQCFLEPTEADMIMINKKVGQKLNFHYNEKVYKDLVMLNGDNHLSKFRNKPAHKPTPFIKRDIEPNLDDFYENISVLDRPVMVRAIKIKSTPISRYDPTDLYNKIQGWKLDQ